MTRIAALGDLNALPANNDILVLVDVSDTTQAASGSTKRVHMDDLMSDSMKISGHSGFSVVAKPTTGSGNAVDVIAGTNGVLRRSGAGNIEFGTIVEANIADDAVTDAKLRDSAGFSVIGRAATGTGTTADIAASANQVLRRDDTGNLGFGDLPRTTTVRHAGGDATLVVSGGTGGTTSGDAIIDMQRRISLNASMGRAQIKLEQPDSGTKTDWVVYTRDAAGAINEELRLSSGGVTLRTGLANANLANMAQSTIKGRAAGGGTGAPQDLTVAQAQGVVLGDVYDFGPGHAGFVSASAVAGTPVVLIANGANDVTQLVRCTGVGVTSGGSRTGFSVSINNGAETDIVTPDFSLRVNADGSLDVRRTSGADTLDIAFHAVWI